MSNVSNKLLIVPCLERSSYEMFDLGQVYSQMLDDAHIACHSRLARNKLLREQTP